MDDVQIRPYTPDDAEDLYTAARESVAEVGAWLSWCHPNYSREEAGAFLGSLSGARAIGTSYQFAIVDRAGAFLGSCGLDGVNRGHGFANLGYWVRTSATGRGVATAATRALAEWAFAETRLERLELVAAAANRASQRVAEKAGAVREGIARSRLQIHGERHDAIVYAFLRSEFNGASGPCD